MADRCYLFQGTRGGGGGNALTQISVAVRRTAAIGDVIAATVVSGRLMDIGVNASFQTNPAMFPILRRSPDIYCVGPVRDFAAVNLDGAYENHPRRHGLSFWEMYFESANEQLRARGLTLGPAFNCRPRLGVFPGEKDELKDAMAQYPRPWIFVCPRSHAWAARTVQDYVWQDACSSLPGTKFWLGLHGAAPSGLVDLNIRDLDRLVRHLSVADLLLSVDSGPIHLAAAVGCPVIAICQASSPELHLNDQNDFRTIYPTGLSCLNCQKNVCPINAHLPPCQKIDPAIISGAALQRLSAKGVSALVSIYKPELKTLNRCLECVLPQVDEVVVCSDTAGVVPAGAKTDLKIKYVTCPRHDIGYGRKQNFAARQSVGKHLLFLNDDVFLEPEAVARMQSEMKDDVALVGNLLRYPDGTIQHAGKVRSPGMMGWGHIDHRQYLPTIKEPVDLENICGACCLVRRDVHFQIGGFDEDFYLYAEDDDYALRVRQAGYRIRYTPHSCGVHLEHQSTSKTGAIMDQVQRANALFDRKWRWYLLKNLNTIPGTF